MQKDEKNEQPTEQTPKGLTVPVPRREDFLANLKKAAQSDKADDSTESDSPPAAAAS